MRVAILGMGAIGHVVARALRGRCELLEVDRTRAPLRGGEVPVDVAIVTTKTPGTPWAAEQAARVLGENGYALTIQNGLGNHETLVARLGPDRVALGVVYVGAALRPDGSLFSTGAGRVALARRAADVGALLEAGGMEVAIVDDPWPAVWRKLVANAALNPTTALFRCTNGELLEHPAGPPLADGLAREVARVATADGVRLAEDEAVRIWRDGARYTAATRSSMLQDVEAGRATEIEAINGAIVRTGEKRGVEAPLNRAIAILVSALAPR